MPQRLRQGWVRISGLDGAVPLGSDDVLFLAGSEVTHAARWPNMPDGSPCGIDVSSYREQPN
ncbi:MAG TPA: hypothetical protein VHV83_10440 [Armatimonadota bacterium]|nr:hypothetical protein [Armatimonadota bacterium]